MKFQSNVFLALAVVLQPSMAKTNLRRNLQGFSGNDNPGIGYGPPEWCRVTLTEINHGENQAGEQILLCVAEDDGDVMFELDMGDVGGIQIQELASGEIIARCPSCRVVNGEHGPKLTGGNPSFSRSRRPGRDLQGTVTKTVLAVRVIDNGAANLGPPSYSEATLSDDVFGNAASGSDPFNLHSQFETCSYGQLDFQPTGDRSSSNNAIVTDIADGVVTVTVDTVDCSAAPETGCDSPLRNAAITQLFNAFSASASSLADHVMFCMPDGTMGGIAYAGVNSWYSVYKNDWCRWTSGQMHEIGHNIGLAHAGEVERNDSRDQYRDQSGMMGFSYGQDDGPVMCFNAAKSWQLGWYSSYNHQFEPSDEMWQGNLVGVSQIEGTSGNFAVIKINNPGSSQDHYINFNRQSGMNSGTKEGGNQVRIVSAGGEGTSYSPSWLQATLVQGGSHTISYGGSYPDIVVTVDTINTSVTPGYASITISTVTSPAPSAAPSTPSPTAEPSSAPSDSPTAGPTQSPTSSPSLSASPSNGPTMGPTDVPSNSPTGAPTDEPSESPTEAPTDEPSMSPTKGPTNSPTSGPTDVPSTSPTTSPSLSSAPSPAPTFIETKYFCQKPAASQDQCSDPGLSQPCNAGSNCGSGGRKCRLLECSSGGGGGGGPGPTPPAPTPPAPTPPAPTPTPPAPTPTPPTGGCPVCSATGSSCCGTCVSKGNPSNRGCFGSGASASGAGDAFATFLVGQP